MNIIKLSRLPRKCDMLDAKYSAQQMREYGMKCVLEQEQGEPVAMRMPKVGDRVVCIEDESLVGTVVYLTAGGSPEIKFGDGSHGTYMLREFSELFRYADTAQQGSDK